VTKVLGSSGSVPSASSRRLRAQIVGSRAGGRPGSECYSGAPTGPPAATRTKWCLRGPRACAGAAVVLIRGRGPSAVSPVGAVRRPGGRQGDSARCRPSPLMATRVTRWCRRIDWFTAGQAGTRSTSCGRACVGHVHEEVGISPTIGDGGASTEAGGAAHPRRRASARIEGGESEVYSRRRSARSPAGVQCRGYGCGTRSRGRAWRAGPWPG